jgi:GNAT superfamily N-acetyltransferase
MSQVRIRRITPADHEELRAFYAGLSAESRRTRFLGPTNGIGANQSAYFCTLGHAHREGFVAVVGATGRPDRVVGHVCVEPECAAVAEVAVAVADDMRGRGIGRELVDAAVGWARLDGIHTLIATMLADNPAIQRLLTGMALPSAAVPIGSGVIEVRIELGPERSAASLNISVWTPRSLRSRRWSAAAVGIAPIPSWRVAPSGTSSATNSPICRSTSPMTGWWSSYGGWSTSIA